MSNSFRRYEILLPQRFNDQQLVPNELIADTLLEIRQHCGAVSSETQIIRGIWEHEGQIFRDELIRVIADVADTSENRMFFQELKESLKSRFQQIEIWMTTHPIDVM